MCSLTSVSGNCNVQVCNTPHQPFFVQEVCVTHDVLVVRRNKSNYIVANFTLKRVC